MFLLLGPWTVHITTDRHTAYAQRKQRGEAPIRFKCGENWDACSDLVYSMNESYRRRMEEHHEENSFTVAPTTGTRPLPGLKLTPSGL